MRVAAMSALVALGACSSPKSGPDGTVEPDPKGWTITIDMSGLDRFVLPADAASWPVAGIATASEGLASVAVGGGLVDVDGSGAFAGTVDVAPGLTPVPILATDAAGHERKGDRTLLAAQFLADGAYNPHAAGLVLGDAVLAAMSDGIADYAADVDVAGEILARDVLSQDDRCVTWPVSANQGAPTATLVRDGGELWLRIRVPNLYVYFEGQCQGLLSTIPVAGEMGGTLDVWTRLSAKAPAAGACLTAFEHTPPEVEIAGWGFDVWGTSGPLQGWIVDLFSGNKSAEARAQLATEVGARADTLLATKLEHVSVYDNTSALELLGKPVVLDLCVSGIASTGDALLAQIAARATGTGSREAPGAPQLEGLVVRAHEGELVLDANVIGQLLYAAWRDDALVRGAPDIDVGVLQILMPGLAEEFPDATTAQVAIDAELPPLVRATPDGPGDLQIELGDMMIELSVGGTRVLRFGTVLTLALELVPEDGALVPKVVDTQARVTLLDERYDGSDTALEQAVQLQIGTAASALLAGGASIALPALPGLGTPTDVTADAGGRYLHLPLAP